MKYIIIKLFLSKTTHLLLLLVIGHVGTELVAVDFFGFSLSKFVCEPIKCMQQEEGSRAVKCLL